MQAYQNCEKSTLTGSFCLQTAVSKKRLEKFLGGEDLDDDIVRHDPSFSAFSIIISPVYTCTGNAFSLIICFIVHLFSSFIETAVSISNGSFSWEKEAEPLLKEYVYAKN